VLGEAFCTYVHPILENSTSVWSLHHIGLVDIIEKVHCLFTKRIFCLSLKLDSLHVRHFKQNLIKCCKITNGLVAIDFNRLQISSLLPTVITHVDGGHNLKLYIQNCRLVVCKFSFARRVHKSGMEHFITQCCIYF